MSFFVKRDLIELIFPCSAFQAQPYNTAQRDRDLRPFFPGLRAVAYGRLFPISDNGRLNQFRNLIELIHLCFV